jgi:hypothetical protein
MDNIEKSLFRKVRIKAFATGENAHTMPIEEDVLKRGAKTIYNKPILWKYNRYFDDAMGHEPDEVPCGFVPQSEDNPIRFVEENGKLYIVIQALLWTKYSGRLIDIFTRDDMHKDVSVEIATIEDEDNTSDRPKIKDFVIAGITLLGEMVNPACKGCEAELLEFSENQREYLKDIEFSEKAIAIDNSKESAVSGAWSNPRRKLFNPISEAPNKKALLREAYLVGDFDTDEPEITKFKYPHHVIRNGKLVVHKDGLEVAFSRASQQGIDRGNVKSHLLRHYRELGLSTENFSEFGMSEEQFNLYFAEDLLVESVGDSNMAKEQEKKPLEESEKMADEETKKEDDAKEEDAKDEKMADEKEDAPAEDKEETPKEEKMEDDEDKKEDEDKEDEDSEKEEDKDDKDESEEDMSCEEMKCKMSEMAETIKKLQDDNKAFMAKIDSMCDYAELKKFKADAEEKEAREKEMAEMEQVMCEVEQRGVSMSEDEKKEFMSKIREFSSVDAWSNYVKAQAFDRAENIDGVIKIGLPYNTAKKHTGSIWDEL